MTTDYKQENLGYALELAAKEEKAAHNYTLELKKEILTDLERTYRSLREIYVLHNPDNQGNIRVTISEQDLIDYCASIAMAQNLIQKEVK